MTEGSLAHYSHRAKPYQAEAEFRLLPQYLAVEQGKRSGNFPYHDIAMIRLTYRPRNTTNEGYVAKVYRRDGHTASLTNLSWKSLVDLERQDAEYRRFVLQLIAEVARANPSVALQAGMPRWLHLVTGLAGLVAVLALVIVMGQAILNRGLPVAFFTGALALYFAWWTVRYLARNRPRGFSAGSVPEEVLPKESGAVASRQ